MSKLSQTNARPTKSAAPQIGQQDAIDMLIAWVAMAAELGLDVQQYYNPVMGRFTVRVGGVVANGDRVEIANKRNEI